MPPSRRISGRAVLAAALALSVAFLAALGPVRAHAAHDEPPTARLLRVGVYETPPLIVFQGDGRYGGIAVDVLRAVAESEGWELEFVPGTWAECFQRLKDGENDIQAAIGISEERRAFLDYAEEDLTLLWGVVYAGGGRGYETVRDLEGARLAMLDKGILTGRFRRMLKDFDVAADIRLAPGMGEAMDMVNDGEADACVVSNLYGRHHTPRENLQATPIVFGAFRIGYAAKRFRVPTVIAALDERLKEFKAKPGSPYYRAMNRWLEPVREVSPPWTTALVVVSAVGLTGLLGLAWAYRRRVFAGREQARRIRREAEMRRLVEEALTASRELYKALFDHALDAIYLVDDLGRVLDANREACVRLGMEREDLLGMPMIEVNTPEARAEARKRWNELLRVGQVRFETVHRIAHASGDVGMPVDVSSRAVRHRGRMLYLSIVRDITERKQSEQALRISEERLRLAFEAANDGLYDWDPRSDEVYFSPRFFTMLGYDPDEWPDTVESWKALVVDEDRPEAVTRAMAFADGGGEYEAEFRMRHRDGSERWIRSRAKVMETDASGRATRILGTHTDITDIKRAEAQLAAKVEELAASNAELQDFAFIASHDLQEPLRKINAFSGLLREEAADALSGDTREYLGSICAAAERMSRLIDDLLRLSRVSTRGNPAQPCDLGEVLAGVLDDLDQTIAEAGAEVQVGEMPTVHADPTQMRQLFQNLVGNALKYQDGGAPRISIAAREQDGRAVISVADNGVGFDEKYLDQIFKPFRRVHDGFPGSGMGLAICKKIVQRHGGGITASGAPGQGSTFTVTLPLGGNEEETP